MADLELLVTVRWPWWWQHLQVGLFLFGRSALLLRLMTPAQGERFAEWLALQVAKRVRVVVRG